ncbi:MAG TPA: DUF6082 family protein [Rugosimonospora sp.]|nr:DUF6082 family protein [Rugosimonospora sp.]
MSVIIVCLAIVAAMAAPAVLIAGSHPSDAALNRLSNIGQAYGILSSVLSAVALVGIALSVTHEAHQMRLYRLELRRSAQYDLLRMMIDEPTKYGPCASSLPVDRSDEYLQRYFFTTLWLNFARTGYESGEISESELRSEILADMFSSEVACQLWRDRSELLKRMNLGEGWSSFLPIVREEYEKAVLVHQAPDHPEVEE